MEEYDDTYCIYLQYFVFDLDSTRVNAHTVSTRYTASLKD